MFSPRRIESEILLALYRYSLFTTDQLATLLHYERKTIHKAFHTLKEKDWVQSLPLSFVERNLKGWTLSKSGVEVEFGLTNEYRPRLLKQTSVLSGQTATCTEATATSPTSSRVVWIAQPMRDSLTGFACGTAAVRRASWKSGRLLKKTCFAGNPYQLYGRRQKTRWTNRARLAPFGWALKTQSCRLRTSPVCKVEMAIAVFHLANSFGSNRFPSTKERAIEDDQQRLDSFINSYVLLIINGERKHPQDDTDQWQVITTDPEIPAHRSPCWHARALHWRPSPNYPASGIQATTGRLCSADSPRASSFPPRKRNL